MAEGKKNMANLSSHVIPHVIIQGPIRPFFHHAHFGSYMYLCILAKIGKPWIFVVKKILRILAIVYIQAWDWDFPHSRQYISVSTKMWRVRNSAKGSFYPH